jgi:hypothetical protein
MLHALDGGAGQLRIVDSGVPHAVVLALLAEQGMTATTEVTERR